MLQGESMADGRVIHLCEEGETSSLEASCVHTAVGDAIDFLKACYRYQILSLKRG